MRSEAGTGPSAGHQPQPGRRMEGSHQQVHRHHAGQRRCSPVRPSRACPAGRPRRPPVSSAMVAKVGAAANDRNSAAPRRSAAAGRPSFLTPSAAGRTCYRCSKASGRCRLVAVVVAHPFHRVVQPPLSPRPLGVRSSILIGAHHHLDAAPVGRIGVEDLARLVLHEYADARQLLVEGRCRRNCSRPALVHLLRREAHAEIMVEVVAVRRHPIELPAHAPAEALDFGQRRAETAMKVMSRCARWTIMPSLWSAM